MFPRITSSFNQQLDQCSGLWLKIQARQLTQFLCRVLCYPLLAGPAVALQNAVFVGRSIPQAATRTSGYIRVPVNVHPFSNPSFFLHQDCDIIEQKNRKKKKHTRDSRGCRQSFQDSHSGLSRPQHRHWHYSCSLSISWKSQHSQVSVKSPQKISQVRQGVQVWQVLLSHWVWRREKKHTMSLHVE